MRYLSWTIVLLVLAGASMQDLKTKQVYRFFWWIGGIAALGLVLFDSRPLQLSVFTELLIYFLLQHILFARFYGRADCRAFCVCAIALTSLGAGLFLYLMHMLAAFLLLAAVQIVKGNVASDGNLSHPVAFLPYITIAFFGVLWYYYT